MFLKKVIFSEMNSGKDNYLMKLLLSVATIIGATGAFFNSVSADDNINTTQFVRISGGDLNPFDTAYTIFQDSRGYMWFAVDGKGYIRYDGRNFVNINERLESGKLTKAVTRDAIEDGDGRIVFVTRGGINLLDLEDKKGEFLNYNIDDIYDPTHIRQGYHEEVFKDSTGRIWYVGNAFVYTYDAETDTYPALIDHAEGPSRIVTAEIDEKDRIWVSTYREGIFVYDIDGKLISSFSEAPGYADDEKLKAVDIISLDQSRMLLATYSGLYTVDKSSFQVEPYYRDIVGNDSSRALVAPDGTLWVTGKLIYRIENDGDYTVYRAGNPSIPYAELYIDREGTVWVSDFAGGVYKNSSSNTGVEYLDPMQSVGLSYLDTKIRNIAVLDQNLWISTSKGVIAYDLNEKKSTRIDGIPPEDTYQIKARNGSVYVSTKDSFYAIDPSSREVRLIKEFDFSKDNPFKAIRAFDVSKRGVVYLSASPGITRIDLRSGEEQNDPKHLPNYVSRSAGVTIDYYEPSDKFLIGVYRTGVYLLDDNTLELTEYEKHSKEIPFADISGINLQGDKAYIYYRDDGFTIYDFETNQFTLDTYPVSAIRCIIDSGKFRWLFQKDGNVYRLNDESGQLQQYTRNDVPQTQTIRSGRCVKLDDRTLLAVTYGGLVLLNTDLQISNENLVKPEIFVTDVAIDGLATNFSSGSIAIKPNESSLNIGFHVNSFVDPERNRYEYRLGEGSDWLKLPDQNSEITLYGLPNGTHQLFFRGSNNTGLMSEAKSIEISVIPNWYQTWQFKVLAVGLLLLLGLLIFWSKLRYEKRMRVAAQEKNEELERSNAEQLKARNEAMEMRREAEEANNAKSKFISLVSHELRTPLQGISGMIELISRQEHGKRTSRYLKACRGSSEEMLRQVNSLIDISRSASPDAAPKYSWTDLKEEVSNICSAYEATARLKGLRLYTSLEVDDNIRVSTDPDMLRQVVTNLLFNAVKYTDEGSIKLRLFTSAKREEEAIFKISVEDTGIGIPENSLMRIFEEFEQVENVETRTRQGVGLGLSICKKIADKLHGRISVESREGAGSIFTFMFQSRYRVVTDEVPFPGKEESLEYVFSGIKSLIVEDNEVNSMYAAELLEMAQIEVHTSPDGNRALEMVASNEYDIVFVDCHMPGMDGFEFARNLRRIEAEQPNRKRSFMIALTADVSGKAQSRCFAAGMDSFISKPYLSSQLYQAIGDFVSSKNATKSAIDAAGGYREEGVDQDK